MNTLTTSCIAFIGLAILFFSCERPVCKNTNPIYDKYPPASREYKTELAKQIGGVDKNKLTYWFKEYIEINSQESLVFNIQGEGLCAVIVLTVKDWDKLEELRKKRGVSFSGAEFVNLIYDVEQDSSNIKFIFRDFERIID